MSACTRVSAQIRHSNPTGRLSVRTQVYFISVYLHCALCTRCANDSFSPDSAVKHIWNTNRCLTSVPCGFGPAVIFFVVGIWMLCNGMRLAWCSELASSLSSSIDESFWNFRAYLKWLRICIETVLSSQIFVLSIHFLPVVAHLVSDSAKKAFLI